MRMSSLKDDPGYDAWVLAGKRIRVFLNGVEHKHVVVADEEEGFILSAVLNDEGRIQTRADDPNEVWYERLEGEVRIELPARPV